jgi:hypothetical protein
LTAFGTVSIVAFRHDIQQFFLGAQSAGLVASAPPGIWSDVIALANELESENVRLQGFSDTVVAYVPTASESGTTSLYRVGALLISVAATMLFSLARGTIVRGAIEAGWAMEPYGSEIYGPALMRAYELEKKADWPRVVLGENIQKLWRDAQSQAPKTVIDGMNIIFAHIESGLGFVDKDGQSAVDYLGQNMRDVIGDGAPDLPALIDAAHVELERQLANHADDAKIKAKLQATLDYFVSRTGPLDRARRDSAKSYAKLRHQP